MMLPDPLRLALALIPVGAYFVLIGLLNVRRRPFVTSGGSDLAALGAAASGLVLVGPIELFRPEAASIEFGNYVWLFLLVFYWLWVWLAVLLGRPRLVIYNISGEELRPLVAEAAREIDPQSRWAGDSLALPTLGVQLHLETWDVMRHASLVSSGNRQSIDGWRQLSAALRDRLGQLQVGRNPRAMGLLSVAAALIGVSIVHMLYHPQQVAQAMQEMFNL
ncbi:MAG: hypothetical protein KF688_11315 [Pirellulales bacterium]|nr:hypothetical protein [Pirellulales bacterium]MBX3432347.1 hypothetical protein [Pirellulales bacterium]